MISVSTFVLSALDISNYIRTLGELSRLDTGIELFFDLLPLYKTSLLKKYIKDFVDKTRVGMHCPMSRCEILAEKGTILLQYSLDRHEECFELAEAMNSRYMVLHTNGIKKMDAREVSYKKELLQERVMLLADMAKKYNCELWVENVGFHKCGNIVADLEFYKNLILNNDNIYSLIDIGHAHVNGWDIPVLFRSLNKKIHGLHIHDNFGTNDQHLPVYQGNINWEPIFDSFQWLKNNCEMILEYAPQTPQKDVVKGIEIIRTKYEDL
jgi:sugar phosphate isomerase/epimerase